MNEYLHNLVVKGAREDSILLKLFFLVLLPIKSEKSSTSCDAWSKVVFNFELLFL